MNKLRIMSKMTKVAMASVMAVALFSATLSLAQADQGNPDVQVNVTGFKTGIITGVMAEAVGIDGKAYGVTPDVVVVNQFGKADGLDSLRSDLQVYFHLREDKGDKSEKSEKIDRMVLVIPQ